MNINFTTLGLWLTGCFMGVTVAMAVDFAAGIWKARRMGVMRTSRRFRQTALKAGRYFLPMVCLSCVDILTFSLLKVPVFTLLMSVFNIFCEWRSVMESTHDEKEIARTAQALAALARNKDNPVLAISELLRLIEGGSQAGD